MLLVKTRLRASPIHGIGLFADEPIAKGTPTWKFLDGFDFRFPPVILEQLSPAAREQFLTYTYFQKGVGMYELCSDDARFFNHSDTPNTMCIQAESGDGLDLAVRDIQVGEEMTCDYKSFDPDWEQKLGRTTSTPPTS